MSTSMTHLPSRGEEHDVSFHQFGAQTGRPSILLDSGHFAGVAACTPSLPRPPTEGPKTGLTSRPTGMSNHTSWDRHHLIYATPNAAITTESLWDLALGRQITYQVVNAIGDMVNVAFRGAYALEVLTATDLYQGRVPEVPHPRSGQERRYSSSLSAPRIDGARE